MAKILIIEDEKILAQMYKDVLESEGFEVKVAFDAEEALEILKSEKFNLILLDILLPRKNGLDLLEELRKEKSSLPIILAFSNFDDPKARAKAFKLGAKEYLLKTDYTPGDLVKRIKKMLSIA